MQKEYIRTLDIEDFKANNFIIDYVDENFAIVNSLANISHNNHEVKLKCFLIAFCIEGYIQLDMNNKTYQLQEGDSLLGLPNSIISHIMLSPQHQIKVAAFSTRFLQRIIKIEKGVWDTATHIYNNPVKHINENKKISTLYQHLIMAKINDKPHLYRRDIIQHLFAAFFCEILNNIDKQISNSDRPSIPKENIKQSDHILRKFVTILSEDNGTHRSVAYYADALCYSPKHLSKVIKQASGKSPLEMINEYTIEHIKYRLKHSDKSIKEIAEEFDFPNQSFFGKYVKTQLGMSPGKYRRTVEK